MMRSFRLLIPVLTIILTAAACGNGDGDGNGEAGGTTVAGSVTTAVETTATTATTASPAGPSTSGDPNPPARVTVQVWFQDQARAQTGEEPIFRPVDRQVQPPAVAAGALDALFAGPTAEEQAGGFQLVLSGATGYADLRIEGGVAHVRLTGGCSSGGSTMTIANELAPTLRQFDTVDFVKIYAPDGSTQEPTGARDSVPACLEP